LSTIVHPTSSTVSMSVTGAADNYSHYSKDLEKESSRNIDTDDFWYRPTMQGLQERRIPKEEREYPASLSPDELEECVSILYYTIWQEYCHG
jgi:hypothetical protein